MITRLEAGDRALFQRLMLSASRVRARTLATCFTHLGGARASILLCLWPLFASGGWPAVARHALATLVFSHLLVQLVKRSVGRPRPSQAMAAASLVAEPDRFSFPSGHAAAALSVALAYAAVWPSFALPILALAMAIGASRVALGVHFPGDVAAGQAIALATHLLLARQGL
jgi:undecaprenyl-diphosphatase